MYDARAMSMNTDDAQVLCTAGTLEQARKGVAMFGEAAIFEYDIQGDELINERLVDYVLIESSQEKT